MVNLIFKISLLLFIGLLVSCDNEINSTTLNVEEKVIERYCTYRANGYCYTCMPGLGGKGCAFKVSPFCSHNGKETVDIIETTRQVYYESGKSSIVTDTQTLKIIQSCR